MELCRIKGLHFARGNMSRLSSPQRHYFFRIKLRVFNLILFLLNIFFSRFRDLRKAIFCECADFFFLNNLY